MNNLYEQFLFKDIEIIDIDNGAALIVVPDNLYEFYTSIQTLRLLLPYVREKLALRVFSLFITKHTLYQNMTFNTNFILNGVKKSGKY